MAKIDDKKQEQFKEVLPSDDHVRAFEKKLEMLRSEEMPRPLASYGDPIEKSHRLPDGMPGYVYNPIFGVCHWSIIENAMKKFIRFDGKYWLITNAAEYCKFTMFDHALRKLKARRVFAQKMADQERAVIVEAETKKVAGQIAMGT